MAKQKRSGRKGDPISLDPLTFDEAMDVLANPPTDGSSSEADPESETSEKRTSPRPSPSGDSA